MTNTPVRIQRKRIKGWKMPANTVYVGRGSRYGNPFRLGKGFNAEMVIGLYKDWLKSPVNNLAEDRIKFLLKGKNLACWCPLNQPCHADILLKIANSGNSLAPRIQI